MTTSSRSSSEPASSEPAGLDSELIPDSGWTARDAESDAGSPRSKSDSGAKPVSGSGSSSSPDSTPSSNVESDPQSASARTQWLNKWTAASVAAVLVAAVVLAAMMRDSEAPSADGSEQVAAAAVEEQSAAADTAAVDTAIPAAGAQIDAEMTERVHAALGGDPDLRTFALLVNEAGLGDAITSGQPVTVFALSSTAVGSLGVDGLTSLRASRPELNQLIGGHLVAGTVSLDNVSEPVGLLTVSGTTPIARVDGSTRFVDNAAILATATHAHVTVHTITTVLN